MGISSIGVDQPEIVMKNIIPVVMAGVLGIYGLIIAVIISNSIVAVSLGKARFDGSQASAQGSACERFPLHTSLRPGKPLSRGPRVHPPCPHPLVTT